MPTEPTSCPFCGQPLLNEEAVAHLHRAQESFEAELRRDEEARLRPETQAKIAAARKAAKDAAKEEVEKLRLENESLRKKRADERIRIETKAKQAAERGYAQRERALKRTVEELNVQKDVLERRVEKLSAQDRGDMQEVDLAEILAKAFPGDTIEKKGRGGDVLHTVIAEVGDRRQRAGMIVYESKDTLRWSNSHVEQIRRDGRLHRTPYLVLVSKALPRGESHLCVREGVVVVHPAHARFVAELMRRLVVETHQAGVGASGQREKTAHLLEYLSGQEFRQTFDAVVGAADTLSALLQKEKQSHERGWAQREGVYDELRRRTATIDERIRTIIAADAAEDGSGMVVELTRQTRRRPVERA